MWTNKIYFYVKLIRLDKPIGIFLLLWPTLWALWFAAQGVPSIKLLLIFTAGVILMRSAGCIANDFADRHLDVHVARTRDRPLASGKISVREAMILFALILTSAFGLVLMLNGLTVMLAFIGAALAIIYPFLKRFTQLPQLGLGLAFSWGIPMAFAATQNSVPASAWCLYATALVWPVIYDTMYAMTDREDDLKIGVKSTAILFGRYDTRILALLQIMFTAGLIWVGILFDCGLPFYCSLATSVILFAYQQWLIQSRQPQKCFEAFLNNNWVGLILFAGIAGSYAL